MPIYEQLEPAFHPKSIAIAGISLTNPMHWSRTFFNALISSDFPGGLYLVNPGGGQVEGHKVYRSLAEIPGEVEYVICMVAAGAVPGLIRRCADKGVKIVQIYSAGFAETGEEEGIKLEAEVVKLARETGIRVIGPNCMGIYCPESHLSFGPHFSKESGSIGFISQSGGFSAKLISQAAVRGIRFSKVISFGNSCDLNEADFLEYLIEDPKTRIIAMYLEGVKESKRFLKVLERSTLRKPVILLKGGTTMGGAHAAMGHTGSLAGSKTAWDAVCRQFRVMQVDSFEELMDVIITVDLLQLPKGRNAVLMGAGGGPSVAITDMFERNGLRVPQLPQDIRDRIRAFTPIAGNIVRNPIEIGQNVEGDIWERVVNITMGWEGSDFLVVYFDLGTFIPSFLPTVPVLLNTMHRAINKSSKPAACIFDVSALSEFAPQILPYIKKEFPAGIPVYYSFEGAARAIDVVLKHHNI